MILQVILLIVALGAGIFTYLSQYYDNYPTIELTTSFLDVIKKPTILGPVAILPTSTDFHLATLAQKVNLSHNTALYRFKIPHPVGHIPGVSPEPILGLPIGQHISLTAEIGGKNIQRKYTPTTLDGEDPGHFHLVVKVSFPV